MAQSNSTHYRAWDHKEWDAAGLDAILDRHEMEYVNQEDDGPDQLRGEWYVADDDAHIIIYGTFGNDNSPGASSYTYADVYDDEEGYRAELAEWEDKPEYLDTEEEEEEDTEPTGPDDNDYVTEDYRTFRVVGTSRVITVGEEEDWHAVIRIEMDRDQYWPNVWQVSDHGNVERLFLADGPPPWSAPPAG